MCGWLSCGCPEHGSLLGSILLLWSVQYSYFYFVSLCLLVSALVRKGALGSLQLVLPALVRCWNSVVRGQLLGIGSRLLSARPSQAEPPVLWAVPSAVDLVVGELTDR